MTRFSRAPRIAISVSSLALVAVIVAACAAGGSGGNSPQGSTQPGSAQLSEQSKLDAPSAAKAERHAANGEGLQNGDSLAYNSVSSLDAAEVATGGAPAAPSQPDSLTALVISTGAVSLQSDDVEQARFEVQKVVLNHAGQITEEETRTNNDGEIKTSLMVLRIPSKDFSTVMGALEKVADLEMSSSNSEDVTTQVIDNSVRIRVERRSIARIQTLLDRARTIRDIVRIESQLTRRQANLNSTLRRQAYLTDQTSLSTITVTLERTKAGAVAPVVHTHLQMDTTGFTAGLYSGWRQLTAAAVGIATFAGISLPWLVVLLLLAPFAWLGGRPVVRRLRTPEVEPAA
ncbi:DUF4349 domain-containing protein [Nocardioides sp.]|uniref:DUF4349 domain-containing protein n=1 Tax=Nocardioides sp. TaxID=35761 RepID=UPI0031FE5B8B|nr:hypothetical protein [Nocardioides sp.]